MTADQKLAQKRLTLLQVAERLRNVSEACRRHSISRSQFYEYKRAFQERGLDGLLDRPPIPRVFPLETSREVGEKVITLSLEHPAWGPLRISDQLRLQGILCEPQHRPEPLDPGESGDPLQSLPPFRGGKERPGPRSHRGADPSPGESQSLFPRAPCGEFLSRDTCSARIPSR